MEIKITKDNFEAEVVKADRPVLVDFWSSSTWPLPRHRRTVTSP